jgi:hypothetical protein
MDGIYVEIPPEKVNLYSFGTLSIFKIFFDKYFRVSSRILYISLGAFLDMTANSSHQILHIAVELFKFQI